MYDIEEIKSMAESYKPLLNIFSEDVFPGISEWDGEDFYGYIKSVFDKVDKHLNTLRKEYPNSYMSNGLVRHRQKSLKQFPKIIELSLQGKRSKAYDTLLKVMEHSGMPFATFKQMTYHDYIKSETNHVFRMREEKDFFHSNLTMQDLFHIPFEKRHLIKNNRFSLSGFPCLYFGSSVYVCWEEMGRPPIENCFTSKFDLSAHHFIDLSILPSRMNENLDYFYKTLIEAEDDMHEDYVRRFEYILTDYLFLWPLVFCCSIRTHYPNSVFKPEYILPQLLLEWLVSDVDLYDGIIFNSTKNHLLSKKFGEGIEMKLKNYVIPARVLKPTGLCEESLRKIKITEPINFEIQTLTSDLPIDIMETDSYSKSVFGKLESILATKEFYKIENASSVGGN